MHTNPFSSLDALLDKIVTKCMITEKSKVWPSCSTTSATCKIRLAQSQFCKQGSSLYMLIISCNDQSVILQSSKSYITLEKQNAVSSIISNSTRTQSPTKQVRVFMSPCLILRPSPFAGPFWGFQLTKETSSLHLSYFHSLFTLQVF